MLRRAREVGPGILVPLAWLFVAAAVAGAVNDHTLFVAHVVMAVLLAVFAVTGRADMREGTLRVWWWVIAVGLVPTVAGVLGFQLDSAPLHAVALFGWMLLPAVGFLDTGRRVEEASWVYFGGAGGCLLGAGLYAAGLAVPVDPATVAGALVVGVGQTAGIADAVVRY